MTTALPAPPTHPPLFDDDFSRGLDPERWVAYYLPHWTTPDRSEARYALSGTGLQLRIDADQLDWRPEDAPLRVSNIQTGSFSGPVGSTIGTHRHRDDGLTVRTETPSRLLWAPTSGRVDITVSASRDPDCMLAAWFVGTEHLSAADAGEICVFEIDASAIGDSTTARTGIKAHSDPRLTSDMSKVTLPFDASRPHTWTAIWGDGETVIGVEGKVIKRMPQAPASPMFLLIDLFEIGPPSGAYPKSATVHRVRAWDGGVS